MTDYYESTNLNYFERINVTVNPWTKVFRYLCLGLFLTTFNINGFWFLEIAMDFAGAFFMILAFRSLRQENRYFFAGWMLAYGVMIQSLVYYVLRLTPYYQMFQAPLLATFEGRIYGNISFALELGWIICFRNGMKRVVAGTDDWNYSIDALILYMIVFNALVIVTGDLNGWFFFLLFTVTFFLILRGIWRQGNDLGDEVYDIRLAKISISSKALLIICLTIWILSLAGVSLAVNHVTLQNVHPVEENGQKVIRQKLMDMGFPEDILADIPDKDVTMWQDAVAVEQYGDTPAGFCRQITVQLPDDTAYVVSYLKFIDKSAFFRNGFYVEVNWDLKAYETVDTGLLYEKKGQAYTCAIPDVKTEKSIVNNILGEYDAWFTTGEIGYPIGSSEQRGYVITRLKKERDEYGDLRSGELLFRYNHMSQPFHFQGYIDYKSQVGDLYYLSNDWKLYTAVW